VCTNIIKYLHMTACEQVAFVVQTQYDFL